jgi:hypothetical protein
MIIPQLVIVSIQTCPGLSDRLEPCLGGKKEGGQVGLADHGEGDGNSVLAPLFPCITVCFFVHQASGVTVL